MVDVTDVGQKLMSDAKGGRSFKVYQKEFKARKLRCCQTIISSVEILGAGYVKRKFGSVRARKVGLIILFSSYSEVLRYVFYMV